MLSPRTERDYRQVVERWTRDGQPDPATWVSARSGKATRRNACAALVWHYRVNLGKTLDIAWVRPLQRTVPSAFSVEELAVIREEALGVHRRCRPVIDLLYSTGARLQEACGITLEDVTDTHIVLRDTKRRPGGLQVHRAVPLGPVSRAAVFELRQLPPGQRNTLVVACQHRVQDWVHFWMPDRVDEDVRILTEGLSQPQSVAPSGSGLSFNVATERDLEVARSVFQGRLSPSQ